tara:strand:- start:464 stop:610 length:147 start_codon:yes stop_codon:yes gene_type:complete
MRESPPSRSSILSSSISDEDFQKNKADIKLKLGLFELIFHALLLVLIV